jgi:hypothetical protein
MEPTISLEQKANVPQTKLLNRVEQAEPNIEVLANARDMMGLPYFSKDNPENPSCIDVFVRAAGLEKTITEHAILHKNIYSTSNERLDGWKKGAAYILDLFGINNFNNVPENPMFARRIQNVITYQQACGLYQPNINANVALGWIVYFSNGKSKVPTHAGIVSAVDNNKKPTKVIHASYTRKKVVEDSIKTLIESGLKVVAYGAPPKRVKN